MKILKFGHQRNFQEVFSYLQTVAPDCASMKGLFFVVFKLYAYSIDPGTKKPGVFNLNENRVNVSNMFPICQIKNL
jgi:hypothetical protein